MDSKNWMSHNKGDVGTMYLKHIKEVLGFLTAQYWGLRVLMWDDMLRKISVGALRGEGTGTALLAPLPGSSAAAALCPPWLASCPAPAGAHALPWGKREEPEAPSCCRHQPASPHCCPRRVRDSEARLTRGVVLRARLRGRADR